MKNSGTVLLETERLTLRRFKEEDIPAVFKNWAGNPDVTKYLLWEYHKTEKETARFLKEYIRQYHKKNFYVWAVERKQDGEVIGTVDATVFKKKAEIGYCFGESFWNNGYAYESLTAMVEFLKTEVGCEIFTAVCAIQNTASVKLLEKIGMRRKNDDVINYISKKGILKCAEYELKC